MQLLINYELHDFSWANKNYRFPEINFLKQKTTDAVFSPGKPRVLVMKLKSKQILNSVDSVLLAYVMSGFQNYFLALVP